MTASKIWDDEKSEGFFAWESLGESARVGECVVSVALVKLVLWGTIGWVAGRLEVTSTSESGLIIFVHRFNFNPNWLSRTAVASLLVLSWVESCACPGQRDACLGQRCGGRKLSLVISFHSLLSRHFAPPCTSLFSNQRSSPGFSDTSAHHTGLQIRWELRQKGRRTDAALNLRSKYA